MNTSKPMLLLLSDKQQNIEFLSNTLQDYCQIFVSNTIEEAKKLFVDFPDIAVSVVDIDDFEIFLNEINDTYGKFIPAIFCVQNDNEEKINSAYRNGAFEVIEKPFIAEMVKNRILKIVCHALSYEGYQDSAYKNQSLLFGSTDGLTHLHNRVYGEQIINDKLKDDSFKNGLFILIDINNFTEFNNKFGRNIGDKFLENFAKKLQKYFDQDALICRVGGDEFVVFWEVDSSTKKANQKVKGLIDVLSTTIQEKNESYCVTISVGTVSVPNYGKTFDELSEKADRALYHSKTLGNNIISDYSDKMTFSTRENEGYHINSLDYQNILDSFKDEAICALSAEEHKILYYNKKAAEVAPNMAVGKICHEVWEHDCDTCPIKKIGEGEFIKTTRFDVQFNEDVEITATKIMWHDHVPAYLMQISPRYKASYIKNLIEASKDKKSKKNKNNKNDDYRVCQYGETIYCKKQFANIDDKQQMIIDSLLMRNHGVGIICGYFDENLTISMISDLAIRVLDYKDFEDFKNYTDASFIKAVKTEEEKVLLRKKLLASEGETWSYPLLGKNGKMISVRICNAISTDERGNKMWLLSLRRYSGHYHDVLTGGYNYEGFILAVNNLRERNADLRKYSILYVDVKGFKALNELYGSDGANNLLIELYRRFSTCKLEPILCARKGSDHFLLLVKKELLDLNELKSLLNFRWEYLNKNIFVLCTCGIYDIEDNWQEIAGMISYANLAKDRIQDEYATPYAKYDDFTKMNNLSSIEALSRFDTALLNKDFEVYFQPIVDAKTEKVVASEALVRWNADDNIISPATFIPVLEESGYIVKLDKYVFEAVREFLLKRQEKNLPILPISINLSKMDFFAEEEMNNMLSRLEKDPFLRKYMRFEITETSFVNLKEKQSQFIEKIRSMNGKVYLDDFGSGSASLDMLTMFNFDSLKIDMHFISELLISKKVGLLVQTIIEMAHRLGLKVIAEGVEEKAQAELLKEFDCDFIQGYLFSKPLRESDFEKFLLKNI